MIFKMEKIPGEDPDILITGSFLFSGTPIYIIKYIAVKNKIK